MKADHIRRAEAQREERTEKTPTQHKAQQRLEKGAHQADKSTSTGSHSSQDHGVDLEPGDPNSGSGGFLGGLSSAFAEAFGKDNSGPIEKPKPNIPPRPAAKPVDPTNPGEAGIKQVTDAVRESGDVSQLNQLDNFRSRLTPEQQKQYDQQLAQLRNDPRINFEYKEGAPEDIALEDLALRGILAANFNNPKMLDQVLNDSVEKDGKFSVVVYPSDINLKDFNQGDQKINGGLASNSNDIAISSDAFYSFLRSGDNAFVHEFSHLQQRVRQDGSHERGRVPGDYPYPEQFEKAFADENFQKFLVDNFLGGNAPKEGLALGNAESWPTISNLFHQDPEALKKASPELYQQMSRYFGLDPITGQQTPPVQLNGTGDPKVALDTLQKSFDQISGGKGSFGTGELEKVLADPNASPELQQAAALLLSSKAWRSLVDVGEGRGKVDNNIDLDDLRQAAEVVGRFPTQPSGPITSEAQAQRVLDQYRALADTADGRGGRDGAVSDNDLKALLTDPGTPADLRAAAQFLLDQ